MTLFIQDLLLKYMLLQKALPAFSSISHASKAHLLFWIYVYTADIDTYAARYVGYTKLRRLLFIAQHCKSRELDAYRLALDALTQPRSLNIQLYRKVMGLVAGRLGPAYSLDATWAEEIDKRAAMQKERLESDLQTSRTGMAKESIRLGYQDLGEFHYARGDLDNALKNFVRTRDYCSIARHNVEMCLNVIKVSVGLDSFAHVSTYVSKAEHATGMNDPKVRHKLKAAAGLAQLSQHNYDSAARKFLDCGPSGLTRGTPQDPGPASFAHVLAPEDVATYGGLCALASLDRPELKRSLLENTTFKGLLDLVPMVRELIYDFCRSRYGACLGALAALKPELLLDVHLHQHVESLYQRIRERCLLQYFIPYLSVDLGSMANTFDTPLPRLEKEIAGLIVTNRMPARIDSQRKTLHRRQVDPREAGYKKVFSMGQEFLREMRAMLFRMSLLEHSVFVEAETRGGAGGGGDARSGGRAGTLGSPHPSQGRAARGQGAGGGTSQARGGDAVLEGESSPEEDTDMGEDFGSANQQDPDLEATLIGEG